MTARCDGISIVSVYAPNGRAVGSEHYQYKLSWFERLGSHLDAATSPGDAVIVAGDFNIAPADVDVYDPAAFEGETHVTKAEREHLGALLDRGLIARIELFKGHPVRAQDLQFHAGSSRIAAEHAKGRMLLIATTNLDARRPVIWNMGEIASSTEPRALDLFRKIMIASASIPALSRR